MKKIVYYASLALFLFGLSACEEEEILREESPLANPNSTNVFFDESNPTSLVLPIDATEFDVVISREKTDAAQTVAIENEHPYSEGLFTIPSSVSFEAGASSATITITLSNLELMKKYHLALAVEYDQTNPYVAQDSFPRLEINVLQEDYAPYADGVYTSTFFEDAWEQVLEYSPSMETYRFKGLWYPGYDVKFQWDGANEISMIGAEDADLVGIETGYVHATYGMVTAWYSTVTYDADSKTFVFPINWQVSAGSFGDFPASYKITSTY